MKEECKLCSANGWGPPQTTDFSISSLMRPTAHHPGHVDPRQDAVLLSTYLLKLGKRTCSVCDEAANCSFYGYYQPAGPLIKESSAEERAIARYHPAHYHPPPPVLQQYGPPYYPPDLCYPGRYYRPPPPGPYHMPPQPDAQMVGISGEPYPPPQYYTAPPCYQHSPQRIPFVEYRCTCPPNSCPKNVLIGPATGKAPAGGGPIDAPSSLAPPGGAFRVKGRACAIESVAESHGSGKDPPPEPTTAIATPRTCPLPMIGDGTPKQEVFEIGDGVRRVCELNGPAKTIGPSSPARGACAPQPPPTAPRRARLGKAMARRSLAGDDTGLLLSVPQPQLTHHSDADDDVLAISPPLSAPIDLSSSDERSTPLVDIKKENEGPTVTTSRKTDALALREHNCSAPIIDSLENTDAAKAVKRRYSRPKLEIDMKDVQLEDVCKTNGIGEHVKLQKRRKISGDQSSIPRVETVKEPKKRAPQNAAHKRIPKTPLEKKSLKRKQVNDLNTPKAKKMLLQPSADEDVRILTTIPGEAAVIKPKNKSALLLDNLIRKNSIDRVDPNGYNSDKELNPAELFLPSNENISQNCTKKTLNINNNVVDNSCHPNGVRPNTIAAVTQLIEKKLAYKNACKIEKVDSKITHNSKSILTPPTDKLKLEEETKLNSAKCEINKEKSVTQSIDTSDDKYSLIKDGICDSVIDNNNGTIEEVLKTLKISKQSKPKIEHKKTEAELADESQNLPKIISDLDENEVKNLSTEISDKNLEKTKPEKVKRCKLNKENGQIKTKSIEKVAKLLEAKKLLIAEEAESTEKDKEFSFDESRLVDKSFDISKAEKPVVKKVKQSVEKVKRKPKSIEKIAKLLVSQKPKLSSDEISSMLDETDIEKDNRDVDNEKCDNGLKRCKLASGESKAKNVEKVVKLLVSKKTAIKTDEASLVVEDACVSPVPVMGKRARRRRSGAAARRARRQLVPLALPALEPRAPPRWSNGWNWDGEHYISKVYLNNDSRLDRTARCYSRMTHDSGDTVGRGDCVLLRASTAKAQPFVARVASLWENPEDGEMMVSLVWYYRPEHTERGREPADAPDEVFASRHRDANSVACIEDKCYVLTFNEYCRYRKRLKAAEEGVRLVPSIVPPLPSSEVPAAVAPNDSKLPPTVSPELVLFCRKIYDFRSKKIQVPNK